MKTEKWQIQIENETYPITINYRFRKTIGLRYNPEKKEFICNVPPFASIEETRRFVYTSAPKLKKRSDKNAMLPPINGDEVYIFGEKVILEGFSNLNEKKQNEFLKKKLLEFLEENVAYNAKLMNITNKYSIRIRKMKTRWGVNSQKNMTLTFNLLLVHFKKETIESVVVHELAHDKIHNHGKGFYRIVYKRLPNYKETHAKLRKGIYE